MDVEEDPMARRDKDPQDAGEARGGGFLRRLLGLLTIAGAVALWRQRQQRREADESLWGEPEQR